MDSKMIRLSPNILTNRITLMRKIGVKDVTRFNQIVTQRIRLKFKDVDLESMPKSKNKMSRFPLNEMDKDLMKQLKEKLGVNATQLYVMEVLTMCIEQELIHVTRTNVN